MMSSWNTADAHVLVRRIRRVVRQRGLAGALLRVVRRVVASEIHVWYVLDPLAERPRPMLPPGLTLCRAAEADARLLDELDTISPTEGVNRMASGHDLWLVLEGDRPLFGCWIFRGRSPAVAARRGVVLLPPGTVSEENIVTIPAARGRGIAPAASAAIADALAEEGQRRIIRRVELKNAGGHHAAEKAGFRPIAVVRFRRIGPACRRSVELIDTARGQFLVEALSA